MSGNSPDHELSILSSMADQLDEYLHDDRLFKTITAYTPRGERLFKMTLGGIYQRITELKEAELDEEQQDELQALIIDVERVRSQAPELFTKKLARELKSYIDSWHWFLQNCWEGDARCATDYPQEVDVRLRIDSLLRIAKDEPATAGERRRIQELDQRLRSKWNPGPFLLPAEERSRYPEAEYWWLYGRPTADADGDA